MGAVLKHDPPAVGHTPHVPGWYVLAEGAARVGACAQIDHLAGEAARGAEAAEGLGLLDAAAAIRAEADAALRWADTHLRPGEPAGEVLEARVHQALAARAATLGRPGDTSAEAALSRVACATVGVADRFNLYRRQVWPLLDAIAVADLPPAPPALACRAPHPDDLAKLCGEPADTDGLCPAHRAGG